MQSMAQTHKPGPRPPRAQANKQQQHAQLASLEAKATAGGKAASEVKAAAEKAAAEAKAAAEEAAAEAKLEQLANATSLLNTTAPTAKQIRTFERQCAIEGTACSCAGQVRYGLGSVWSAYRASTGAIACTNKVFGDVSACPRYAESDVNHRILVNSQSPMQAMRRASFSWCASGTRMRPCSLAALAIRVGHGTPRRERGGNRAGTGDKI